MSLFLPRKRLCFTESFSLETTKVRTRLLNRGTIPDFCHFFPTKHIIRSVERIFGLFLNVCHTKVIHMASIRHVKTASGSTAVQVVEYQKRKVVVLKHVGSARKTEELPLLEKQARQWLETYTGQSSFFPSQLTQSPYMTQWDGRQFVGVHYGLAYEVCLAIYARLGYGQIDDPLLRDLCIIRLIEPASKIRSLELLKRYFDIHYAERTLYRHLPLFVTYKAQIEEIATICTKRETGDDLSVVLYDVTTLYFESFNSDNLRKPGFSKDGKSQQPQVVVGLLVNKEGFPLGQEAFAGNTFEGKTMLPVLRAFRNTQKTKHCTVVADAGMLSFANMQELKAEGLTYIVGARLGNVSPKILTRIIQALKDTQEGVSIRIPTAHGDLICAYCEKRARKDRWDMEKQLTKARMLVSHKETVRRAKFVKVDEAGVYTINETLQQKTETLLGIKGYYTNIPKEQMNDTDVIARYGNLWRVEQSFRMSKSDLVSRPIFHHKEDSIKAHLITCFVALSMGKYLEHLSGSSLRHIIDLLCQIPDARLRHIQTKKEILLRAPINPDLNPLLETLGVSY